MKIFKTAFIYFLLGSSLIYAQNKALLYDFKEIPQSIMVNPGVETSYKWFAGVPLLSGISFQAGSSGISVDDIFANDGLDINDKIRDRAIFGMNTRDELSGTYQVELLTAGFRGKNRPENFYSFGIYNEGDAIGYWFRDLAILGFEGNADNLGRRFDLEHLKTRGEIINVFHFGVNKQVDDKWTVGFRGKLYSSIINFQSTRNDGFFVTTEGQNNLLANTLVADVELRTSGLSALENAIDDETIGSVLTNRAFLGGDLGLGIDLGFTHRLNDRTTITASLLDLGFIYHTTDVKNFSLQGSATVEGVEIILPDALADPDEDVYQSLVDEIEELLPFVEDDQNYITFRPTKLNASIRYNFGKPLGEDEDCDCDYRVSRARDRTAYRNAVGGHLYAINRPRGPQVALSAFYQRNFGRGLALKTTYTIDKFSLTNIGVGINIQAGPLNMYALADNLLAYQNIAASHYASFQFGINIISWGSKR